MNVIYSSIYTPVRDKVIVQTAQVALTFPRGQATHQACCRRSYFVTCLFSAIKIQINSEITNFYLSFLIPNWRIK